MSETIKVKIQNIIESQIPEFLNEDSPLFKEFLEQYYISQEHRTGTIDLANNFIDYKDIDNFNKETFYTKLVEPCKLLNDLREFDNTIKVNHTKGFPKKYGLLKINNEIITYTSKTKDTFEGCIRGFSGITDVVVKKNHEDLIFKSTQAEFHSKNSIITNLNFKFFSEIFNKFKVQFTPGFENREFDKNIDIQNILLRARDYYSSKGTDTSYKLSFNVLFNEDVEIIKPQDYMLRPSDNKFFITKNILVELISGDLDPLTLKGETIYQETPDGTASASIYNVEIRPIDNNFLYEISLDPTTIFLNFISTKKTKLLESTTANQLNIFVDSTVGFSESGSLLVQSKEYNFPIFIEYSDKTINQFLNVSGNNFPLFKGDSILEDNYAYVDVNGSKVEFRIINIISDIDYSETSSLRVDDIINLSSFGLDLGENIEYSEWLHNLPTIHNIDSITPTAEQNIWRVKLFDSVKFTVGETIFLVNSDDDPNSIQTSVRRIINENEFEINGDELILTKRKIKKSLKKSNVFNYPKVNSLVSNIQNSYIDKEKNNFYIASSGLPDYRVIADNRSVDVSTPVNPNPFSGVGTTTILNCNRVHRFFTGERIFYESTSEIGIPTGVYFVYNIGNINDSRQISLSFSNSDLFSGKYVNIPFESTGNIIKIDYENKELEHQKLLRKFPLDRENFSNIDDVSTNNKPIGMLVNGVEIYSPTLYDENIYYGKLDNIQIISSGDDYDVINTPDLEISDVVNNVTYGSGAKAHLNIEGSLKSIRIVNPGSGYDGNLKVSIYGGNGKNAEIFPNVSKSKILSGFRGDGTGINPTEDSIRFVFPHNFEDGEVIEYLSNNNPEIEYFDPVSQEIRKLPSNSFYFAGVLSDTIIKLYRTKEDAAKKINEIDLTTSPSFGFHFFRSLESKFTLLEVSVQNGGENYSNKRVIVPPNTDGNKTRNGINIVDDYIFAKNHNFKEKDLVVYTTEGDPILNLEKSKNYYVTVIDKNSFKLSFAGFDKSISDENYNKKKYIRFRSVGTEVHKFSYPPIKLEIEAYPETANGKLNLPILEPVVTGSVESVFLEEYGEGYGTNSILNFHRRPLVQVKPPTSEALLRPIVIDGSIVEVQILNFGNGYGKDTDLIIDGKGNFADIYPIIENGRIRSVIVLNGGVGYDSTTTIRVRKRGFGSRFFGNVFEWKINQIEKNKSILNTEDEGILVPSKNQQDSLQFIHFYPPRLLRRQLDDNLTLQNRETLNPTESPVLGWSYDGFPIYGPYTQVDSRIQLIRNSYRQIVERNPKLRPTGNSFPDGFFIQDYIFDIEFGDGLDEHNGKFIKNADFPDGTYAYFYTIELDNSRNSIPKFPYVIGNDFVRNPQIENYDPSFKQNIDLSKLNLVRNTSHYYLNSQNSDYDLIDSVEEKYKQEFNVRTISTSGIDDIQIYNPGDNYKVGDLLKFKNEGSGGVGANAFVSSIQGRNILSVNIGINTVFPTTFSKSGSKITGISQSPIEFTNNEYVIIDNISDNRFKFLEGSRKVSISNISVGLVTSILDVNETGTITKITPNQIEGFEVNDYIRIDNEILKILQILPRESRFLVERIENTGIHTAGISEVTLLPRKFVFFDNTSNLISTSNEIVYFNPQEVVSVGELEKEFNIVGVGTIRIPERGIYIPDHKYRTGQPLTYNSGLDGIPLFVSETLSGPQFTLTDNQTVYAVNLGKDFIGISTSGYEFNGIGSSISPLYFSSATSGIGLAHSLTTQNLEITGNVENYSLSVFTEQRHNLENGDLINLNLVPQITEIVKFKYDPKIRKITTDLLNFNSEEIDLINSEIPISSVDLVTGDKVVYYSNENTPVGGLVDNESYFIIKESPNKIKLSKYYSDSMSGISIDLLTLGEGIHSIAKINPKIKATKGNTVIFDTSDPSLANMSLRLYRDNNFNIELESYSYILPSGERFINTGNINYPRELYYTFTSVDQIITSDIEVNNNNCIEILNSDLNIDYEIIKIDSENFKINLQGKPERLDYTLDNLTNLSYTSRSKNISGPIDKLQINYGGRTYKKLPKIIDIISDSGINAILKPESSKIGKISSTERVKDGFDYPTDTTLLPLLSVPAVVQVEDISRVDFVGIVTGGRNYNTAPTLKVIGNDRIILNAVLQGSSIVDVEIIQNTDDLPGPLKIVPIRNSNGYSIDDIEVNNGTEVTLELLNSDNKLFPLITTGFGSTETIFPFEIGDEIFIERCRVVSNERDENGILIPKDNFNSSNYGYRFFKVTGINTTNFTITYSMEGVKDNLDLGDYSPDFGFGYVVNKKDMAEFEMFTANDLSYTSNELVLGFNKQGTNTFSAKVMEDGWDNDINELRLIDVKGELNLGDKLQGQVSRLNGTVTKVNIFNLRSKLGVTRDKLNDLGDRVGFTNDHYQRISDNNYYQKFSYSVKGRVPYNVWKEPIRSLIHPSGFKEFSDLNIDSKSDATMKVGTASSVDLLVNIDNLQSMYKKNNFAMVTEDEQFEDGSIERILFEEGVVLRPYILSKSNKVINLDDFSSQFDGANILEVIANKPVTFISTDIYRLGVSTEGLAIGDKIGFSTYHFYPNDAYIFDIEENFIRLSEDTPHRLLSINGITTSVTENLNFSRSIPGHRIVGTTEFELSNNGIPLFYREFDSSNGITTTINLETNTFILNNHNFQTGQKIKYTPELKKSSVEISSSVGSGAILEAVFDENYSVNRIKVLDGGSGYSAINLPEIEIVNTQPPLESAIFTPNIDTSTGEILSIGIANSGLGYFPISSGTIGIGTTSEVEGRRDIIINVGGGIGGAIYENGYNVAITTTISGISSNIEPNFSGQQNRFWGFLQPFIPSNSTSGSGIDAKFSVFIVYDSSTGQPISTSVVLRDGGRGYSVGDNVSISGTYMGGSSPQNDLSFNVSRVSSTRIISEANEEYLNVPGETLVGYGTGAIFDIKRNNLGDIIEVKVVNGGINYDLTDNISIAGTNIGGISPEDNLLLSPTVLGTDKLPEILYVEKRTRDQFRVSGTPTGNILELNTLGVGTHSFSFEQTNENSIITIDNIIQNPIYKKNLILQLSNPIKLNDDAIYLTSGVEELSLNDIIQINDEYIKIKNINFDGENSLLVERGTLGTKIDVHDIDDPVYVVSGNYNIVKNKIHFSSAPYGPTGLPGTKINSSFSGRVFSRRKDPFNLNDENIIFDDISDQFTGIAATEFTLKSNGESVVGIFTNTNSITGGASGIDINNNPIITINNIPQVGGTDYVIDTPGENTIRFISGVPLAGKITNVAINTGFGYQPFVRGSAKAVVSSSGEITDVILTGSGSGYRIPPLVSIASTVGFGASISATIGLGGTITSLILENSGSGYSTTILPEIRIDRPKNYSNISLEYADGYSGIGTGAKASVMVGNGSSIVAFNLDSPGTSYKVGDVLTIPGLVLDPNSTNFEEFKITVLETFTDSFSGWYPGQFIQFDDISPFFNGNKKNFTLTITVAGDTQVLSLKTQDPEDISLTNNLFVIINDILQVPGESYTYTGSRLSFKEAPKPGSKSVILFFRGSDLDVEQVDPPRTIKEGDFVRIDKNKFDPFGRPQFERVVKNIVATDILDTFPYDSLGISTDPEKIRPIHWTKQTRDKVMNGVLYSKSRPELKSRIFPTAKVIKDIGITDTQLYVDSAIPLFEDIDEERGFTEDLRDIVILDNTNINEPEVKSIVSTGTTISSINIISSGNGYLSTVNPKVSISSRFIIRKDPIFNWNLNVGLSTDKNFNSIAYGDAFVSVGENGNYAFSEDGFNWNLGRPIDVDVDFNDVIGVNNNYVAVGNTGTIYGIAGFSTVLNWNKKSLFTLSSDLIGRPIITPSDYKGNFNKISYNSLNDTIVIVGNSGAIFSGVGIGTTQVYDNIVSFSNINSVANNGNNFVVVGNTGDILYSETGSNWERVRVKRTQFNLNDVIWDGNKFIAVGNNGTIIKSIDDLTIWELIPTNISNNINKIHHNSGLYTILDDLGKLHFSKNLSDWFIREIRPEDDIFNITSIGDKNNEIYVSVGSSGFISYATPVKNEAVAISTVSSDTLESITIINGGFGYDTNRSIPVIVESETTRIENIFSIKAKGDFGIISDVKVFPIGNNIGFGTTSPGIEFTLVSENFGGEILPNMEYTPLEVGDRFIISNSNVKCGHALTGITTSLGGMSNYPNSKVGTAVSFIDGVYSVEGLTESSLGITTVRCLFAPVPDIGADRINVDIGINTTGFYGRYSFGIIYDYQNRAREQPKSFKINKDSGLVGLSTGPLIYRTRPLN